MSTAYFPERIHSRPPRIPVAKKLESVSEFKKRRLAQKQKEKYIFWGIMAGVGTIVFLFFIGYMSGNSAVDKQREIAVLADKLGKAKTLGEAEKIAAEIDRLEKSSKNSSSQAISEVYFKKPFSLTTESTKFKVVFTGISFYDQANDYSPGQWAAVRQSAPKDKVQLKLDFTVKNLGPRDSWSPRFGGELKTEKGNMYGGRYSPGNGEGEMVEIDKAIEGYVFFWIPRDCTPVEIQLMGGINAIIKIPKSLLAEGQKEIAKNIQDEQVARFLKFK